MGDTLTTNRLNVSNLDSVTLTAYKVKDCGQNLGSDNCITNAKKVLIPVLRLTIEGVVKKKKENMEQKISEKNQNYKIAHFLY